jgi:hypothetical protein
MQDETGFAQAIVDSLTKEEFEFVWNSTPEDDDIMEIFFESDAKMAEWISKASPEDALKYTKMYTILKKMFSQKEENLKAQS